MFLRNQTRIWFFKEAEPTFAFIFSRHYLFYPTLFFK